MDSLGSANDKNLVWLGSGFMLSGVLLIGLPVCIPRAHPLAGIGKVGCAILSVNSLAVAGYCWRRWHKTIVPDIQLQEAIWEQEREELLLNQSQERLDRNILVSVSKTSEDEEATLSSSENQLTQLTQKQLERMFYEGSDDVRNWLRENGLISLENRLKPAPEEGSDQITSASTSTSNSQDQLAETDSGSDGSEIPERHLEAIHLLIEGGLKLTKAIWLVAGIKSGRKFTRYSQAYKSKYEH